MTGDPFGVSFMPGTSGDPQQGQKPSPVQQAIQTLSFSIPKNAGASAFTPQSLLTSQGSGQLGGAMPDAANTLEMIKRLLFGNQPPGAPQLPGQGGGGPNLTPAFRPIEPGGPTGGGPTGGGPSAPPMPPGGAPRPSAGPVPSVYPGGGGTQPGAPTPPPVLDNPYAPSDLSKGPSETSFTPPSFAGSGGGGRGPRNKEL